MKPDVSSGEQDAISGASSVFDLPPRFWDTPSMRYSPVEMEAINVRGMANAVWRRSLDGRVDDRWKALKHENEEGEGEARGRAERQRDESRVQNNPFGGNMPIQPIGPLYSIYTLAIATILHTLRQPPLDRLSHRPFSARRRSDRVEVVSTPPCFDRGRPRTARAAHRATIPPKVRHRMRH